MPFGWGFLYCGTLVIACVSWRTWEHVCSTFASLARTLTLKNGKQRHNLCILVWEHRAPETFTWGWGGGALGAPFPTPPPGGGSKGRLSSFHLHISNLHKPPSPPQLKAPVQQEQDTKGKRFHKKRFVAWPLELGLGTLNPRFAAWPLELGLVPVFRATRRGGGGGNKAGTAELHVLRCSVSFNPFALSPMFQSRGPADPPCALLEPSTGWLWWALHLHSRGGALAQPKPLTGVVLNCRSSTAGWPMNGASDHLELSRVGSTKI